MFKNRPRKTPKITVPTASLIDYRSESVTTRLDKIADSYQQLEVLLAELERKMPPEPADPAPEIELVRKPR